MYTCKASLQIYISPFALEIAPNIALNHIKTCPPPKFIVCFIPKYSSCLSIVDRFSLAEAEVDSEGIAQAPISNGRIVFAWYDVRPVLTMAIHFFVDCSLTQIEVWWEAKFWMKVQPLTALAARPVCTGSATPWAHPELSPRSGDYSQAFGLVWALKSFSQRSSESCVGYARAIYQRSVLRR